MSDRRMIGSMIGVAGGVVCAGLAAVFLFANPYASPLTSPFADRTTTATIVIVSALGGAGVLAAIAAMRGAWRALIVLFVVSFLPFGFYFMLTPGIFHWIGFAQLGYLASAALVRRSG